MTQLELPGVSPNLPLRIWRLEISAVKTGEEEEKIVQTARRKCKTVPPSRVSGRLSLAERWEHAETDLSPDK